ncbi:MAG TPA: hypothetical protein VF249_03245, partial [Arthrobacter sp.]
QSRLLVAAEHALPGQEVGAWVSAIEYAMGQGRTETVLAAKLFHEEASESWRLFGRSMLANGSAHRSKG